MTISHNNFIDMSDIVSVYALCKINKNVRLGTYSSTSWQYHPFGNDTDCAYTDTTTYTKETTVLHKHILTDAEKANRKVCVGFGGGTGKYGYMYDVFLVKADDINTLCEKAGVTPTDLATLIADTTSITAILNSASAVKFMIKNCTGDFMASFIASADCLALLETSPYKTTIQSNDHWAKFLAMVA